MPELPEVETTLRGISPHVIGQKIISIKVRNGNLRWPAPADLEETLKGQNVLSTFRRAKYLLLAFPLGHLMIHLGMSGRLQLVDKNELVRKHDHIDLGLSSGHMLRYSDPRRFGSVLWLTGDPYQHKLLAGLGPEPFDQQVNADYLYRMSRKRKQPVKQFIMNGQIIVGVGNIYANEALYRSGIHPARASGAISKQRYQLLTGNIQQVLNKAIEAGGTTLKDFVNGEGKPGYFQQQLDVYGRTGKPCRRCDQILREIRLGQRSTVFCNRCQT